MYPRSCFYLRLLAAEGYVACQFDALLELLTIREHLELFAALRGVPEHQMEEQVDALITHLGMRAHQHTLAQALSGGTKRKLSMAISLLGAPSVLLLDEPSCGTDPILHTSFI